MRLELCADGKSYSFQASISYRLHSSLPARRGLLRTSAAASMRSGRCIESLFSRLLSSDAARYRGLKATLLILPVGIVTSTPESSSLLIDSNTLLRSILMIRASSAGKLSSRRLRTIKRFSRDVPPKSPRFSGCSFILQFLHLCCVERNLWSGNHTNLSCCPMACLLIARP